MIDPREWQEIATAPASKYGEPVELKLRTGETGLGRVFSIEGSPNRAYSMGDTWLTLMERPTHWRPVTEGDGRD